MEYSPEAVFQERSARFRSGFDRLNGRWELIANLRLYAFLVAVAAAAVAVWQSWPALWLLSVAGVLLFVALVSLHNRVGRERRRFEELYRVNEEAIERLHRRWDDVPQGPQMPTNETNGREEDPYAADLDILGHASLFQLVGTVGTFMGEQTLVSWLLAPAPPERIRARQEAVRELTPMIDLRDELYVRGRLMGTSAEGEKPDPGPFLTWAESDPWLAQHAWLRWAAAGSTALFWCLVLAHVLGLISYPLWLYVGILNLGFTLTLGRKVHSIIERAEAGEHAFRHYATAFRLISEAPLQSADLQRLQSELATAGTPAHAALRRLYRITTFTLPETAIMYLLVSAVTLWEVHHLAVLEGWQRVFGKHARGWLARLGEFEALSALAALSYSEPAWGFPGVAPDAVCLEARDLGHPLLADEVRVANDVTVGPPGTFLLVTGSNMSGKSTLLRALGVNVVLAQTGGPVCASSLTMPPVALRTSMRVEDSLERGVSYFMAELERLKSVVDAARNGAEAGEDERRLFYLLDEILQGTNTHERQIAARRVIMYLLSRGAIGAVSTHDLTLADAPEVARAAHCVHFTETITDSAGGPQMHFDYKLRPGIATSTNALTLMQIVGLDLE